MSISIGSNIASLRAQRRLSNSTVEISNIFERLSSGQRINKASDDAAGLAVVSSLDSSKRVFTQGVKNYNDGISLLNIADGALDQLTQITTRLKELAEQSSNGSYSVVQRKAIDKEGQALSKEYLRIAQSTKFNGKQIFSGDFGELRLQGDFGTNGGIQSTLGGAVGSGVFGEALSTGFSFSYFHLVDLNNDGITDFVGDNGAALGRGDGTFTATSTIAFGSSPETADLNNDGFLDVLSYGKKVYLGRGDGTFGSGSTVFTNTINNFTFGDVNNDGNQDFVGNVTYGGSQKLTVRFGTGTGSFGAATTYSLGTNANYTKLGDLNGDGLLDVVTNNYSGGGKIDVRYGTGDGSFGTSISYLMTGNGNSIEISDFNNDGISDVVAASFTGQVSIRLGQSNGTLSSVTSTFTGQSGGASYPGLTIGDINGDGNSDVAIVASGYYQGDTGVAIMTGKGDGTFNTVTFYKAGDNGAINVGFGDVNGDGTLDLMESEYLGSGLVVRNNISTSGVSPLQQFDLTTRTGSLQALSQFSNSLSRLSTQRGKLGAFESRLDVAKNVLQSSADNYAVASSRIKDADLAQESSNLVRVKILQQAGAAVLAQANQQPALAIKLLAP
jgi:flagellin